jgi:prephenate dehydrogenase
MEAPVSLIKIFQTLAAFTTEVKTGGDSQSVRGDLIEMISTLAERLDEAERLAEKKGYASLKEAMEALPQKGV